MSEKELKEVAWLVESGSMYVDRAFSTEIGAVKACDDRNDRSVVTGLVRRDDAEGVIAQLRAEVDRFREGLGIAQRHRDELLAEVEALRQDAERYRWLRDEPMKGRSTCPAVLMVDHTCRPAFDQPGYGHASVRCGPVLDAAIDAAMAAKDGV